MQPQQALLAVVVVMALVFIGGSYKAIVDQGKSGKPMPHPSTIKVDWPTVIVSVILMAGTLYGVYVHDTKLMYGGFIAIIAYHVLWRFIQHMKTR